MPRTRNWNLFRSGIGWWCKIEGLPLRREALSMILLRCIGWRCKIKRLPFVEALAAGLGRFGIALTAVLRRFVDH